MQSEEWKGFIICREGGYWNNEYWQLGSKHRRTASVELMLSGGWMLVTYKEGYTYERNKISDQDTALLWAKHWIVYGKSLQEEINGFLESVKSP